MFFFKISELFLHFVQDFEGSETILAEEEASEGTADGFVGLIDLFEEYFGGVVVVERLLVGMEVASEVAVPLLDLIVGGVLVKMQHLVWITIHN